MKENRCAADPLPGPPDGLLVLKGEGGTGRDWAIVEGERRRAQLIRESLLLLTPSSPGRQLIIAQGQAVS